MLCVVGTRPEAVKVAPVVLALRAAGWEPILVTTGQHGAVVGEALNAFGIIPEVRLEEWSRGPNLAELHTELVRRLEEIVASTDPAVVLVQGDTATTLAGALVGFWADVPVAHLEAGLRSGSLAEPFPEEANRRMVSQITALHLAPTPAAEAALIAEGSDPGHVLVVGNTVVDAVRLLAARPGITASERPLVLVTCHRRENWGAGVARVAEALRRIVAARPDVEVVVAAHPNPAVRAVLDDSLGGVGAVSVRDAIRYEEFVSLLARARVAVTDSGGVQEEAAALGVPGVVTREVTERREGVEAGLAVLVGTDPDRIVDEVFRVIDRPSDRVGVWSDCPYGDGRASERTVAALGWLVEANAMPEPFVPGL